MVSRPRIFIAVTTAIKDKKITKKIVDMSKSFLCARNHSPVFSLGFLTKLPIAPNRTIVMIIEVCATKAIVKRQVITIREPNATDSVMPDGC